VSPNPSDGLIHITLSQPDHQPLLALNIYNVMGELVFQYDRPVNDRLTVDLRSQPNGIYYGRAMIGGKLFVKKILICH
jgi:hypothetical protein